MQVRALVRTIAAASLWVASAAMAQMGAGGGRGGPPAGPIPSDPSVRTTYVRLGQARGIVYEPIAKGPKSRIAVFVMHDSADYTSFAPCTELSKRGYTVLCAASGGGSASGIDRIVLEAKTGVSYLRTLSGVAKVVLFGHSGGATLMTAYQAIAEQGTGFCNGTDKLAKCPESLAGLPKADGVLLADPNWGIAEMTLFSIDPAVTDEATGRRIDPALDLFNPANGFNPKGSTYSQAFITRFQQGQGKREMRLIAAAQARVAAIAAGTGHYTDDEPFDVPGGNTFGPNNKLFPQDVRLMSHTRDPHVLVHPDGSETVQVVHSVRPAMGFSSMTGSLGGGALRTTARTFLSTFAIRVTPDYGYNEDSVRGIEWTSSYSSPPGNITGITVPLLTVGMTGNWEYLASETIYNNAASKDKQVAFIEGAQHMLSTCERCETTPGQFGDTQKTLFDYVDKWLSKPGRFL